MGVRLTSAGLVLAGLMGFSGVAMASNALASFGDIDFGDGVQVVSSVNAAPTSLLVSAASGYASAGVIAGNGSDGFDIVRLSGPGGSVGIGGGWVEAIKLTGVASGQVLLSAHLVGDVEGADGDFSVHYYVSSAPIPIDLQDARNALIADDVDPSVPGSAQLFGFAKSNLSGTNHFNESRDNLLTMIGGQTYYLVGLYSGDFSGAGGAAGSMHFAVGLDSVTTGTGGQLLRGAAAVSSVPETSSLSMLFGGLATLALAWRRKPA